LKNLVNLVLISHEVMGLLIDEECVFSHKSSALGQIFVLSLLLVYWLEQTA